MACALPVSSSTRLACAPALRRLGARRAGSLRLHRTRSDGCGLLDDAQRRHALGEAGLRLVAGRTWDRATDQVEDALACDASSTFRAPAAARPARGLMPRLVGSHQQPTVRPRPRLDLPSGRRNVGQAAIRTLRGCWCHRLGGRTRPPTSLTRTIKGCAADQASADSSPTVTPVYLRAPAGSGTERQPRAAVFPDRSVVSRHDRPALSRMSSSAVHARARGRSPRAPLARWAGKARTIPRPLAALLTVATIQVARGCLVLPPFQGPDEDAHFAYVQYLAETGKRPNL